MNREKSLIERMTKVLPRTKKQINKLFESDSEILESGNTFQLVNIDEFSHEDLFREHDPFILGWNMAVGALSDIYASGGTPFFYAHSLTIQKEWGDDFVETVMKGVAAALNKSETAFIGGDFGVSEIWRYTATVIGESDKPVLRSGAKPGDHIYITGKIGKGNIEALLRLYSDRKYFSTVTEKIPLQFPIRYKESQIIKDFASSCIDTSDGVFNGLKTIAQQSNCGFVIDTLPLITGASLIAKLSGLSKLLLFFGEAGEYELLCTIPEKMVNEFLAAAKARKADFHFLGKIHEEKKELRDNSNIYDLQSFNLSARDYERINDYIGDVSAWLEVNG